MHQHKLFQKSNKVYLLTVFQISLGLFHIVHLEDKKKQKNKTKKQNKTKQKNKTNKNKKTKTKTKTTRSLEMNVEQCFF